MYREINRFRLKPEEMMGMIGDAIRILDEGDTIMLIERLHSEVDRLNSDVDHLHTDIDRLKGETEQLRGETEQLQGEKEQLQEQNVQLTEALNEKDREIAELRKLVLQVKG